MFYIDPPNRCLVLSVFIIMFSSVYNHMKIRMCFCYRRTSPLYKLCDHQNPNSLSIYISWQTTIRLRASANFKFLKDDARKGLGWGSKWRGTFLLRSMNVTNPLHVKLASAFLWMKELDDEVKKDDGD